MQGARISLIQNFAGFIILKKTVAMVWLGSCVEEGPCVKGGSCVSGRGPNLKQICVIIACGAVSRRGRLIGMLWRGLPHLNPASATLPRFYPTTPLRPPTQNSVLFSTPLHCSARPSLCRRSSPPAPTSRNNTKGRWLPELVIAQNRNRTPLLPRPLLNCCPCSHWHWQLSVQ